MMTWVDLAPVVKESYRLLSEVDYLRHKRLLLIERGRLTKKVPFSVFITDKALNEEFCQVLTENLLELERQGK